ncbi:MAG: tryptophan-rich sensory protein [Clostridia bacterium]|nr:tryptophan-rich sensory protein [Clostridia bacterium]MBQ7289066.1 tryptophan-rich sensory protein [Clostridia bacterium]
MKKINWKELIVNLLIVYAVAGLSAFISNQGMKDYAALNKPPLTPPGVVFPIVWTILFTLMGISAYLVFESLSDRRDFPFTIYALQLIFNFFWSIIFFNSKQYFFALIWLVVLWFLILGMIIAFYRHNKLAAYLQIPYLVWVTFAGYLNAGVWLLNR